MGARLLERDPLIPHFPTRAVAWVLEIVLPPTHPDFAAARAQIADPGYSGRPEGGRGFYHYQINIFYELLSESRKKRSVPGITLYAIADNVVLPD